MEGSACGLGRMLVGIRAWGSIKMVWKMQDWMCLLKENEEEGGGACRFPVFTASSCLRVCIAVMKHPSGQTAVPQPQWPPCKEFSIPYWLMPFVTEQDYSCFWLCHQKFHGTQVHLVCMQYSFCTLSIWELEVWGECNSINERPMRNKE